MIKQERALLVEAWLAGYLSAIDEDEMTEKLEEVTDFAAYSIEHHSSLIEDESEADHLDGIVDGFDAGLAVAQKIEQGETLFNVTISQEDDGIDGLPPGTVVLFWFIGTDEQSMIDGLKAALVPNAE